jgi:hypothetical protein
LKLKLITHSNNLCTIGKLGYDNEIICQTIERPWLDNKVNISCIPAGIYQVKPVKSPKFGDTFEVCDVPGRTHILIHKSNRASELHGCIAPVSSYGIISNEWAGLASKPAYDKLMALLGDSEHEIEIVRY